MQNDKPEKKGKNMILFQITDEDAQVLAADILQRKLTDEEMQSIKNRLKMPDWHDELSELISELE